ncbi:ATPase, T2SS/T4P/T4SS family [Psychrobacillus sp. FSL K6-2684]|uniref:ATPase, T2SS/T4P/T4SS family n=1 Tax=unclassified Psychrobacillus TaxID=2636677 RepID=UPI0030F809D5
MSFQLNLLIILLIIATVVLVVGIRFFQNRNVVTVDNEHEREKYSLPAIQSYISNRMTELTTMDLYSLGLNPTEFERQKKRQKELKEMLRNCNTGNISAKTYVREFMFDELTKGYGFNEDNVNWVIPFDRPNQLSARECFDILLYVYQKKHGKYALGTMIDEYELAKPKKGGGFRINELEIRTIYKEKVKNLSLEDKIRVITQRNYSSYKGFGVIDEICDMAIDGVSGGVSDIPSSFENIDDEQLLVTSMMNNTFSGFRSVWIMYQGKTIHISFLDFETVSELRRIVGNVYKYNYPGQLSESKPLMVNEMHDGSRVTVSRPAAAESWNFFIRKKYDSKKLEIEQLITQENAELPIGVIRFLVKGNRVSAITGAQGSGKTTLLQIVVGYIHESLNLRVVETMFELGLRKLYPKRNILTFQETETVTGEDLMSFIKKTDGHVNIVGEAATSPVAASVVQSAQVASLFTLFTHHAKTLQDLVNDLVRSLMREKLFSDEKSAEQEVVNVIEFDIHPEQNYVGERFIERITECIPVHGHGEVYKELPAPQSHEERLNIMLESATKYFQQQTQRKQFVESNIVEFRDGKYVAVNPISKKRQEEIKRKLSEEDRKEFEEFIEKHWGDAS